MQHPLRQARPDDPFLRLRLDDADIDAYVIDGDHVAVLRTGRRAGMAWVTALGDDAARIVALIDQLRPHGFDGVTTHEQVWEHLPDDIRGSDVGHWSLWELGLAECAPADAPHGVSASAGAHSASEMVELAADDPRIDPLLAHSDSAYTFAGDPGVASWLGIEEGGELVAVGARRETHHGVAHLVSICTDPAHRGKGLARVVTAALAAQALDAGATRVCLEMYAGNEAAARAYRAVGFEEWGRYRSASVVGPSSPASEE